MIADIWRKTLGLIYGSKISKISIIYIRTFLLSSFEWSMNILTISQWLQPRGFSWLYTRHPHIGHLLTTPINYLEPIDYTICFRERNTQYASTSGTTWRLRLQGLVGFFYPRESILLLKECSFPPYPAHDFTSTFSILCHYDLYTEPGYSFPPWRFLFVPI